jgi:hypothetical protein
MAGDWIKMRTDLASNRYVISMAESMRHSSDFQRWCCGQKCDIGVTRRAAIYVVVTGLLKVWGVARSQGELVNSEDGRPLADILLRPSSLADIDEVSDLPGFGSAMEAAGWVKAEEGPAVRFPDCVRHIFSKDEVKKLKDANRQAEHREKVAALSRIASRDCHASRHAEVATTEPIPNITDKSKYPSPSTSARGSGDGVLVMQWGKTRSESDLLNDSKVDEMFGIVVANGFAHDTDEDRARFFGLTLYVRRQKSSNRIGLLTRIIDGRAKSRFHKSTDWRSRPTDADLDRARKAIRALDADEDFDSQNGKAAS